MTVNSDMNFNYSHNSASLTQVAHFLAPRVSEQHDARWAQAHLCQAEMACQVYNLCRSGRRVTRSLVRDAGTPHSESDVTAHRLARFRKYCPTISPSSSIPEEQSHPQQPRNDQNSFLQVNQQKRSCGFPTTPKRLVPLIILADVLTMLAALREQHYDS